PHTKQVWEPMESQKKYPRSNSDPDVTLRSTFNAESTEPGKPLESSGAISYDEVGGDTVEIKNEDNHLKESRPYRSEMDKNCQNGFHFEAKTLSVL
ncbi:hypothetical protein Q8G47_27985, partial [Klebsiella pneumoniae]|uniref:hypothetical protein n=1 Tax=Klebsiella pneumoniae TaxID=573 RepID=UPI003013853E